MKKCKYCMSEIDENAKICPNCRKKQGSKKIYIKIVILIIIFLIFGLWFLCIQNTANQKSKNSSFNSEISVFKQNLLYTCSNLEDIANEIRNYWHDSIFEDKYEGDINKAIEQALNDNQETIEKVKKEKEKISKSYNNIRSSECYSDYCDEIKESVKSAYNLYLDFYSLATSPSGNYNNYSDNFSKIDSEILKYYNDIKELQNLFNE